MNRRAGIRLLLVDDDEGLRAVLTSELRRQGLAVDAVPDAEAALEAIERAVYDVAIVDLNLPGMPGQQLIRELRRRSPETESIVLTGHGSIDAAVQTLKDGAYDFLTKPCNLDELEAVVRKAAEKRDLVRRNRMLQRELARQERFGGFIGESRALAEVLAIIDKVAPTDSTVLIQGESGVGKELAARAIHRASARAKQPFVVVDCTSLQESLLLSELFGHERGAFSGAVARKPGLFEVADGGTLFLDEIGELSPPLQARILRVLDRGTFRHVGGVHDIQVDVRLICATNRDLKAMVEAGAFRRDLYYRINVVSFTLPPLRARLEDVPALAEHFARTLPVAPNRPVTITPEAMERLRRYHWPGNVRELQNVIERALILCEGARIDVGDLPADLRGGPAGPCEDLTADTPTLAELERRYIRRLLDRYGGHRAKVAAALGISERNLYRKLKEIEPLGGDA